MTESQAFDHGFFGTRTLGEMPDDEILIAAFLEGQREEREVAAAEMAHEAFMTDLYGH